MTHRRSFRVAAFACFAGLTAASCGGASSGDDVDQDTPVATAESEPAASVSETDGGANGAVVPASLQFTAPLVGGGEIAGDELAGKPTAFWFWSPT